MGEQQYIAPERIWLGDTRSWFSYKSDFHNIEYVRIDTVHAEEVKAQGSESGESSGSPRPAPGTLQALVDELRFVPDVEIPESCETHFFETVADWLRRRNEEGG